LIFNIIWLGDDARVESPDEIREQVIASVEELATNNG